MLGSSRTHTGSDLIALGMAAAERGHRVKYTLASKLVNEPAEAADERHYRRPRVHQKSGIEARWAFPAGRTVACAKGAINRPHPGLSARTPTGSTGGYDYQRLKFSGSQSAILALIQLFELWKSLTAFPGPTSSSRRARS